MKVLVVVPHRIAGMGYMRSQVIAQFAFLARSGWQVAVLSVGKADGPEAVFIRELHDKGMTCHFIEPSSPSPLNYLKAIRQTVCLIRELGPTAIYAREIWGGLVAALARRLSGRSDLQFVYDVRGAVPEEIALTESGLKGKLKAGLFELLERYAISSATAINAVTARLSGHIRNKLGRGADAIIPCCIAGLPADNAAERAHLREQCGFSPADTVYVYSGGLSKWQLFDETVEMFSRIVARDERAKLLVLSAGQSGRLLDGRLPPGTWQVRSLRQEEVASHLQVGDIGILLRDDNIVNRVAFPIKFTEYLAAGLPVISTKGVAEIANIIQDSNTGITITPRSPDVSPVIEWARQVTGARDQWRDRCRAYVEQHLVWSAYESEYARLYGKTR